MQVRAKENSQEFGNCGCGRSPTGKCCGWHALTEDAYRVKLSEWEFENYKKLAQNTWGDSCTNENSK